MDYNKYIAPDGKVLFNTENFTWGNSMYSVHDLSLIILDKDEAEALYKAYQEEQERIKELEIAKQNEEVQDSNITTLALNDAGEYEEPSAIESDPLTSFKKNKLIELMAKGVNLSPNITKVKLKTQNI